MHQGSKTFLTAPFVTMVPMCLMALALPLLLLAAPNATAQQQNQTPPQPGTVVVPAASENALRRLELLIECAALPDNLVRLSCYDALAGVPQGSGEGLSEPDLSELIIAQISAEARLSFDEVLNLLDETQVDFGGWKYITRYRDSTAGSNGDGDGRDDGFRVIKGAVYGGPGESAGPIELIWPSAQRDASTSVFAQAPQFFARLPASNRAGVALVLSCEDGIESVRVLADKAVQDALFNPDHPSSWIEASISLDASVPLETRLRWSPIGLGESRVSAARADWQVLRYGRGQASKTLIDAIGRSRAMRLELRKLTRAGQQRARPFIIDFDLDQSNGAADAVAQSIHNACEER